MRIIIREYKKTNLPSVVDLLNELKGFTSTTQKIDKKNVEKIFKEMIESPQIYYNFVAEVNGIIVEFLSLSTRFRFVPTKLLPSFATSCTLSMLHDTLYIA